MTVAQALAVAVMRLRGPAAPEFLRESAHADAQILLAEVLHTDRTWLRTHATDELDTTLLDIYGILLDARLRGTPVAYLTRKAGFYGREFYVDERVLIPRPESEHLVEAALDELRATLAERMQSARNGRVTVLDVGTGSGALGLTIAAELDEADVTLVDVSPAALEVASENARQLGLSARVRVLESDLTSAVDGPFDCIVANLPYVPSGDVPPEPNPVSFEPRVALDGGADGLDLYRTLLGDVRRIAAPGAALFFEARDRWRAGGWGGRTANALAVAKNAACAGAAARAQMYAASYRSIAPTNTPTPRDARRSAHGG